MNVTAHEFVTVDMRGLKAALVVCAHERRVSVSAVVRDAVAHAFAIGGDVGQEPLMAAARTRLPVPMSKVSFRLTGDEVRRLDAGAKGAGVSRSAFLAQLLDGVNVSALAGRRDGVIALISSNSELSTLSRNIRHLADLLRRSDLDVARRYREMLDTLCGDVDRHLRLAGDVLTQLQPRPRNVRPSIRGGTQPAKKRD